MILLIIMFPPQILNPQISLEDLMAIYGSLKSRGIKLVKLSPENGMITEYSVPTTKAFPDNITASPDGNLWFTEFYTNKIGNISPSTDIITEYNIPIANAGPAGIAMGPDGNLWFTESSINKIGEISPITSVITEYDIPVADAGPTGITAGPDGNLWFTEEIGNIGEISPKTEWLQNTMLSYFSYSSWPSRYNCRA